MKVVPVADPHSPGTVSHTNEPLRHLEILRGGDFEIARIAVHEANMMARLLGERRFIGRVCGRRGERQGIVQHARAKRLRRLREKISSRGSVPRIMRDASPRLTVSVA